MSGCPSCFVEPSAQQRREVARTHAHRGPALACIDMHARHAVIDRREYSAPCLSASSISCFDCALRCLSLRALRLGDVKGSPADKGAVPVVGSKSAPVAFSGRYRRGFLSHGLRPRRGSEHAAIRRSVPGSGGLLCHRVRMTTRQPSEMRAATSADHAPLITPSVAGTRSQSPNTDASVRKSGTPLAITTVGASPSPHHAGMPRQ